MTRFIDKKFSKRFNVFIMLLGIVFSSCTRLFSPPDMLPLFEDIDFRREMREFVQGISASAKTQNPSFVIIPQNGQQLIVDHLSSMKLNTSYVQAIDAIGREDLFYGYDEDDQPTLLTQQNDIIKVLDKGLESGLSILVTDYCTTPVKVDDSYQNNFAKGYLSFAAGRELDSIPSYPDVPYRHNTNNIPVVSAASNFLYLLDQHNFTRTEFLSAVQATDYDLIIMDAFDNDGMIFTAREINSLKLKKSGGSRLVIAYMSIGEAENYRYYWKEKWSLNPPDWLDSQNDHWDGNYKVRYWHKVWQEIIYGHSHSYLQRILAAGFDGVYLDIIDAFEYYEDLYESF